MRIRTVGGWLSFEPVRRLKIAEQVATSMREAILGGKLRPGDPLPSERELASQFDVNRSTVREAIHRLEGWGLVEVRHGGATMVRDFLVSAGFQLLPFLIAPAGEPDPAMLRDLLEMRAMLLGWTAREAASRAAPEQVATLRRLLRRLESAAPDQLQELDFAFFEAQVELTGNKVLGLLANAVKQVYLENRGLFANMYAGGLDLTHHRAAVAAIESGDSAAAEAAMSAYAQGPLALFAGVPRV